MEAEADFFLVESSDLAGFFGFTSLTEVFDSFSAGLSSLPDTDLASFFEDVLADLVLVEAALFEEVASLPPFLSLAFAGVVDLVDFAGSFRGFSLVAEAGSVFFLLLLLLLGALSGVEVFPLDCVSAVPSAALADAGLEADFDLGSETDFFTFDCTMIFSGILHSDPAK